MYWNWIAFQSGNENAQKTNVDCAKAGKSADKMVWPWLDRFQSLVAVSFLLTVYLIYFSHRNALSQPLVYGFDCIVLVNGKMLLVFC